MESYYAGVYWLGRKESAESCALRAERFFQALSQYDAVFNRWFRKAYTRKEALKRPFTPTQATFEKMFLEKKNQSLDGFQFGVWTGHEEGSGGAASFFCGASSRRIPGNCLVYLPYEGADADRMLTIPMLTRLMRVMAQAWEPEAGVLMSNAHLRDLGDAADADVLVGWVTYLSRRRGQVPPLPFPVRVEPVDDLGTLIILTPERFTASNPEHVALGPRSVRCWMARGCSVRSSPWTPSGIEERCPAPGADGHPRARPRRCPPGGACPGGHRKEAVHGGVSMGIDTPTCVPW